jgi:uncharacterized Fe-S cluster-containing radical SAM superfamily protein
MKLSFPFDPAERAEETELLVMKDGKRLYYRFRPAPYYGGIATADAIGCSFLCAYCWNYNRNLYPQRFDKFYSAQEVSSRLLKIAHQRSFHLFRITGSEPVLGENSFQHLLKVITHIFREKPRSIFILETNGFFLGYRKELIEKLKFQNLWIRIALKGTDEDTFQNITGAKKEFFLYPIIALKELEKQGIKAWPAIMEDLFTENEIERLKRLLHERNIKAELEFEYLERYPFVLENMDKRNIQIKK